MPCRYTTGVDYPGNDMAPCGPPGCILPVAGAPVDCEAKCNATSGCVAYIFAPADCSHVRGPICWLKSSIGAPDKVGFLRANLYVVMCDPAASNLAMHHCPGCQLQEQPCDGSARINWRRHPVAVGRSGQRIIYPMGRVPPTADGPWCRRLPVRTARCRRRQRVDESEWAVGVGADYDRCPCPLWPDTELVYLGAVSGGVVPQRRGTHVLGCHCQKYVVQTHF